MKAISSLKAAFWRRYSHYALFRRLRPRLMTMILALVLPVSLTCMAISIVSAAQGRALIEENSQNALSMYLDQVALRCAYENVDFENDFPGLLKDELPGLAKTVEQFHGAFYLSRDGRETWLTRPDGSVEALDSDFEALDRGADAFYWESGDIPLRALVVFHYDFSLASLPAPFWIGMALAILTVLLCPLLYKRLQLDILEPMAVLEAAMEGVKKDRAYRIPPQSGRHSDEFLNLFSEFNAMAQEAQASYEKDVKMLETEMDNLRLQVNPHMLLNSFNMIYALAESKNYPVIQDYTLCLVDYFRYVLRWGQKLVSVEQELEFVDNFIRIQRIRFPGRFSYVYQAAEDCLDAQIPPLLIQNFVENAIKYALEPTKPIEIVVSVRKEEGDGGKEKLHIAIADTGSGIRPEVLEKLEKREPYVDEAGHRHIGIYNCFRRIELFYGEEGDIHFSSGQGGGTQIYLIIPYMLLGDEAEKEARG
ncbi:MAG: histidine kinase [Clostridia bacterium]|nr:histidine kinase [Clostridia bacterium]